MKLLFIGDIYGKTGRQAVEKGLPTLIEEHLPDWVILNGENATGGSGLSPRHARKLKLFGTDIITTGNHLFARKDWVELLQKTDFVLRPHNIGGDKFVGTGFKIFEKEDNKKIAVINLAGRVFMERAACPFKTADKMLSNIDKEIPVFVDFHAEATSEKLALAWHLAGKVTAVVGTHTHVQTSDNRILPGETATITDVGMTGARDGIIGVNKQTIINRFTKGYSEKFVCEHGISKIEGVIITYSQESRKAKAIDRIRLEI